MKQDEKFSTVVSSTGAIAGAVGLLAANTVAPLFSAVLIVGGTVATAGALFYKMTEESKTRRKPGIHKSKSAS